MISFFKDVYSRLCTCTHRFLATDFQANKVPHERLYHRPAALKAVVVDIAFFTVTKFWENERRSAFPELFIYLLQVIELAQCSNVDRSSTECRWHKR